MRLSEAILLGAKQFRLAPYQLISDGHACALGAAYYALGWMNEEGEFRKPGKVCKEQAPLLTWLKTGTPSVPCGCTEDPLLNYGNARGVIAHIFNEHVFGDQTWTLEKLCDWVKSVEPPTASEALQIADRFFPVDTKGDTQAEIERYSDQGVK